MDGLNGCTELHPPPFIQHTDDAELREEILDCNLRF